MFGQEVVENIPFMNVTRDFMLWDSICIGEDVPTNINGWFPSFAAMAASDVPIAFFSQRQEAETGTAYTNMKKKTGLDWPADFSSLGIRLTYPDPVNVDMYDGDRTASKMFLNAVTEHASLSVFLGGSDTKVLSLKPAHAPSGYGPTGNQAGGSNLSSFSSIDTMGVPIGGNRWLWVVAPLTLPKDISIEVQLSFTKHGKDILNLLNIVQPVEFAAGTLKNWATIEVGLRGTRQTQQDGAFHR
jgi:hypothetical protein